MFFCGGVGGGVALDLGRRLYWFQSTTLLNLENFGGGQWNLLVPQTTEMPPEVRIQFNIYSNKGEFIKEESLNVGYSVFAFADFYNLKN